MPNNMFQGLAPAQFSSLVPRGWPKNIDPKKHQKLLHAAIFTNKTGVIVWKNVGKLIYVNVMNIFQHGAYGCNNSSVSFHHEKPFKWLFEGPGQSPVKLEREKTPAQRWHDPLLLWYTPKYEILSSCFINTVNSISGQTHISSYHTAACISHLIPYYNIYIILLTSIYDVYDNANVYGTDTVSIDIYVPVYPSSLYQTCRVVQRNAGGLSLAGFQSGSNITKRLAPMRFRPHPPAFLT